ncbi:Dyp-type peroxidase family [Klebsiella variicola]|uniref:Dyp-type peroxidase n=1 Tax=Klebsiella variicola TaxID=244366 RepID=UPI000E2AA7DD|nr:Dyp-type peroxidase [Klebsiella variicola]SXF12082.1 Dyp-type peroxidase family [Klebsiella variicola]
MSNRVLDLHDIQGNILGGFNTDIQVLLFFSVPDERIPYASAWLATLADEVTTVTDVTNGRELIKTIVGPDAPTWLFVAVGLRMNAKDVGFSDIAFNTGHLKRAKSVLNDHSDPTLWVAGSATKPVDVLLLVGGNDEMAVNGRVARIIAAADKIDIKLAWRELAHRLNNDREHFGFHDGISQPKIAGYDPDGLIGPGHFIFGYPRTEGGNPTKPTFDPRGVADNGSLLVWRRLNQNVREFRNFCLVASAELSSQWPDLSEQHIAALIVGRWPSGSPLMKGQTIDPSPQTNENNFDFSEDNEGKSCPFGAHIRKVNPRAGQKKDVVEIPRILRRGIPYGKNYDEAPDDNERGLNFIAFQTSIKDQFEFLTQHWMNSDTKPTNENDLLVGRHTPPGHLFVQSPKGPLLLTGPTTPWITPCGGAYLFAPSRSGLRKLAEPPSPAIQWLPRKLMQKITYKLKFKL